MANEPEDPNAPSEEPDTPEEEAPTADPEPPPTEEEKKEIQIKIDYLKAEIDKSIKKFQGKQNRNARFGVVVKLSTLGLSSVVTILLGINLEPLDVYNRIALILSALTSFVSGISTFFDFNELSIKYKDTLDKLEMLKVKLEYLELGLEHSSISQIAKLKDEYLSILTETYAFFQDVRKDDTDNTGKETES